MSRVGKHAIAIPQGVTVEVKPNELKAKGKNGEGVVAITKDVVLKQADGQISVSLSEEATNRAMWATTQRNIVNLFKGLDKGFEKKLEINGVGFRAQVTGKELVMQLGYSHDVKYPIPEGIKITVDKQTAITIAGSDKQKVGQVAAEIRSWRAPEPYKGKGIKYEGERIIRKEGKKK